MWIEEGAILLAYSQLLRGKALVRGGEWEKGVDGFCNALYYLSWYTTDERQRWCSSTASTLSSTG